ncbi:MAG TPA: peptide-N4-asparagine amidase [Acidobacteriaceae bacterium]|nr:peptide-N4-asparagine amidase [Acidobacteriaceae bacterium]
MQTTAPSLGMRRLTWMTAAFLLASASAVGAQVVIAPSTPQVGSSNPVTAEPPVPRPHTKPCVVQLFNNLEFADFNTKSFSYTPPAACPGPWAKVVFTADFTVTAGRQYDRTAAFYLGHANIYYGTTAEPRATLSPSWHVERDVTDLTPIFKSDQTGEANIGNFVGVSGGVTYNGIIYANAALEFYPASWQDGPAVTPDIVIPVNGTGGDAGTLNTTTDQITQVLNLPMNVERVYLDIIAQSQSNDEFWYFCVPNDQTSNLESCGNTAFRETEVTIDGKPAGVAPVYPWIYTGGIDPYLWEPIPGVQTLDFKPYRVDLTPFAGVLDDGNPHTVGVSVYNADSYFLATANLLVYTDHGKQKVTGGILSNTLTSAPNPVVTENIKLDAAGTYTGSVLVTSNRNFEISGYVNTSHGRVDTTVRQNVDFSNKQEFVVNATTDDQNAQQLTTVDSETNTRGGFSSGMAEKHFSYPLNINYSFVANSDGTYTQATSVDQQDLVNTSQQVNRFRAYESNLSNEVKAADTLTFDANFNVTGSTGTKTTQTYRFQDSFGHCYDRTLTAADHVLTNVSGGYGCGNHYR